jgi:hypothetical protein
VRGGQAGRFADGAVDVDRFSTCAADQVVVIVTNAVFEAGRRPGGLNPPEQPLLGQHAEGIVNCLSRDGTDFGAHFLGNGVRRTVRATCYGPQHSQSLDCDLETVIAEQLGWVGGHAQILGRILDFVQKWTDASFSPKKEIIFRLHHAMHCFGRGKVLFES